MEKELKDIEKIKESVEKMEDCKTKSMILEDIKKKEKLKEVLK